MRVSDEQMADKDLALVFIAGTSKEARAAERVLTDRQVDYCLGPEEFTRQGVFLPSQERGLGFCVVTGQAQFCCELLKEAGLRRGVIEAEE